MLSFVDAIKQIIADIQVSGGAIIEHSSVAPALTQRLREYAAQKLREVNSGNYTLLEWFNEGLFDEYVRVCGIYLRKIGIVDENTVFNLVEKVIDIKTYGKCRATYQTHNFEGNLIAALVEVWERNGDEQTIAYTFAKDRWLISWDYQNSHWNVTGLGRLFLELSPVQAVTFLLGVDSLFSTSRYDFRHINPDLLREEFNTKFDSQNILQLMPPQQDILFRLGVLRERDEYDPEKIRLTPLGKVVVERVLSEDNPLRDAAKSLIESEEIGDTYKGSSSELYRVLEVVSKHELIDDANRQSIETSIKLYQDGKYQDSLRVMYPSIEAIVNMMLIRARKQPGDFNGLTRKLQWLEQQKIIPIDVSSAGEIITGRNKIVHGNFTPPDDYVFPLCLLALRYLRRLLAEYRFNADVEATG
jgi:hypothetical protein